MTAKGNAVLVETLGSSLRRGGAALESVPDLLKRILAEEAWREFVTPRGEVARHERFAEFLATPPTKGLGTSVDLVRRIVSSDPEALDLLDQALQRPPSVHAFDNVQGTEAPAGNSKDAALRRLRKDAPELHAEVLAGGLSAHAAMVRAGFRPKTFTVRPDPASAARTLRRHMTADDLRALARLLLDEEDA